MRSVTRFNRHSGFTLIELLVVVIILAILAAIVIPQFSSATTDTQESALDSNLGGMRNAIELYRAQHNTYPGAVASSAAVGTCTTRGTGAANSQQAFLDHMLMFTDAAGNACSLGDGAVFKYGPYLRKGVPADGITQVSAVVVTSAGTPLNTTTAVTAPTGGWAYDTRSGQIVMNSNANDSRTARYFSH